jgi:hypothetical protein
MHSEYVFEYNKDIRAFIVIIFCYSWYIFDALYYVNGSLNRNSLKDKLMFSVIFTKFNIMNKCQMLLLLLLLLLLVLLFILLGILIIQLEWSRVSGITSDSRISRCQTWTWTMHRNVPWVIWTNNYTHYLGQHFIPIYSCFYQILLLFFFLYTCFPGNFGNFPNSSLVFFFFLLLLSL